MRLEFSSVAFAAVLTAIVFPSIAFAKEDCQALDQQKAFLTRQLVRLQRELNWVNSKEREQEMRDRQKIIDEQEKQILELQAKKQGVYKDEVSLLKDDIAKSRRVIKQYQDDVKRLLKQIDETQAELGKVEQKMEKDKCTKCKPNHHLDASGNCVCDEGGSRPGGAGVCR